jgi:hypothetical protein
MVIAIKVTSTAPTYPLFSMEYFVLIIIYIYISNDKDNPFRSMVIFSCRVYNLSMAIANSKHIQQGFLPIQVPMWEDAHAFNAPSAGRLAEAFRSGFQSQAPLGTFFRLWKITMFN